MKYEVPSSARRPVASMFPRLAGQPRGAASGLRELGIAVGYGVGVAASVGSGQWRPASVGGALELGARRVLMAADATEEADGAAAGGRTTSSRALSTVSVANANRTATRGRGHGRIGLGRSAFMLRQA